MKTWHSINWFMSLNLKIKHLNLIDFDDQWRSFTQIQQHTYVSILIIYSFIFFSWKWMRLRWRLISSVSISNTICIKDLRFQHTTEMNDIHIYLHNIKTINTICWSITLQLTILYIWNQRILYTQFCLIFIVYIVIKISKLHVFM